MEMRHPIFPPLVFVFSYVSLCHSLCRFSFSIFLHFFLLSTSVFNYFSLLLSLALLFLLLPPLPSFYLSHLPLPISHCQGSEYSDFISHLLCAALLCSAPESTRSCGITIPLCPHHLSTLPAHSVRSLMFNAFSPPVCLL